MMTVGLPSRLVPYHDPMEFHFCFLPTSVRNRWWTQIFFFYLKISVRTWVGGKQLQLLSLEGNFPDPFTLNIIISWMFVSAALPQAIDRTLENLPVLCFSGLPIRSCCLLDTDHLGRWDTERLTSGACDHTAGFRPSLDLGEDTCWGFRRVTDRKLPNHRARCSEHTHLHSLEMCRMEIAVSENVHNAGCLSCLYLYSKSKGTTPPPSIFCTPFLHSHIHA